MVLEILPLLVLVAAEVELLLTPVLVMKCDDPWLAASALDAA